METEYNWSDISTAPKDGTRILAYGNGLRVDVWRWEIQQYHSKPKPYWARENSIYGVLADRACQPLMWMPIPDVSPIVKQ